MKVGFSFSKKAPPKEERRALGAAARGEENEVKKDFVSNVADNQVESVEPAAKKAKLVIPAKPNTFQVGVGKASQPALYVPESQAERESADRFEMAAADSDVAQGEVTYGLTKRSRPTEAKTETDSRHESALEKVISGRDADTRKYRDEVKDLPDVATEDDYEQTPIEFFGEAMLRGMGWEEGKAVGRNGKGIAVPVEYVPRPARLGLGAAPAELPSNDKRFIKQGEKRGPKPDMVLPTGPDGKVRHVRNLDEKLVERVKPGPAVGKAMVVIAGLHCGLIGKIVSIEQNEGRSDRATVVLKPSDETVVVRTKELADLGTPEADKARAEVTGHGKKRSQPGSSSGRGEGKASDRDRPGSGRDSKGKHADERPSASHPPEESWIRTGIRVKIISKRYEEGKLYLKKAEIVDVTAPLTCSLLLDHNRQVVHKVAQRHLETSLPKTSGRVLILKGELKGQRAKLLDRSTETELGVVQLTEDFTCHKLPLDNIAEYVGQEDLDD